MRSRIALDGNLSRTGSETVGTDSYPSDTSIGLLDLADSTARSSFALCSA